MAAFTPADQAIGDAAGGGKVGSAAVRVAVTEGDQITRGG